MCVFLSMIYSSWNVWPTITALSPWAAVCQGCWLKEEYNRGLICKSASSITGEYIHCDGFTCHLDGLDVLWCWFHRRSECKCYGVTEASTQISEVGLPSQAMYDTVVIPASSSWEGNCPWEWGRSCSGDSRELEIPGTRDVAKETCSLWAESVQGKGHAAAAGCATGLQLPNPLDLTSLHHCLTGQTQSYRTCVCSDGFWSCFGCISIPRPSLWERECLPVQASTLGVCHLLFEFQRAS